MKPLQSEDLEHILKHTLPLWEQMRGRNIFIAGGTGFFGIWLLESLTRCNRSLNLDLSITVLSRTPEAFAREVPHLASNNHIRTLKGDVRNFTFPDGNFDYVIHAAAPTTGDAAGGARDLLDILVTGTDRMLEFARARGAERFLFVSSGAVYGSQPAYLSHISEDTLGGPAWLETSGVYGEGKRVAEQMCAIAARECGFGVTIARCFSFVGPHLPLDAHFAIGNFIGDALAGRDILLRSDGTSVRSYLYAADLAIWLWTLLLRGGASGTIPSVFNVGSDQAISIGDLARCVIRELNPSGKIHAAIDPLVGSERSRYVPDVGRAKEILGLHQTIDLDEAIRRTAAWYR